MFWVSDPSKAHSPWSKWAHFPLIHVEAGLESGSNSAQFRRTKKAHGPWLARDDRRYPKKKMLRVNATQFFSHVTAAKLMVAIQTQNKRLHVMTPAWLLKTTYKVQRQTPCRIWVQTGIAGFSIKLHWTGLTSRLSIWEDSTTTAWQLKLNSVQRALTRKGCWHTPHSIVSEPEVGTSTWIKANLLCHVQMSVVNRSTRHQNSEGSVWLQN